MISFNMQGKVLKLVAREMGLEIRVPVEMPDLWSELFAAVVWVPQTLIRRAQYGPDKFDPAIRGMPAAFCEEFPELCKEESNN